MTEVYAAEEAEEPVGTGFRTYEVYQRERVGETTNLVDPRHFLGQEYLEDPFTVPGVLRENYPCYRDWVGNRFWVTRYDDVTSVFVDDANFETRPLHAAYGAALSGRDLGIDPGVADAWVALSVAAQEACVERVTAHLEAAGPKATLDLAEAMDLLAVELFRDVSGLADAAEHAWELLGAIRTGTGWDESQRINGLGAAVELAGLIDAALIDASLSKRPGVDDLLAVLAANGANGADGVVTLLEHDTRTLPASLANLWCLLLTHPEQMAMVSDEPRLMKFAYLESLRHSPPDVAAGRFARHEVERFGRLLPQGALVHLSAAAANRDPRQFERPDQFDIARKDLCQREPRGQYRADGLPAGIVFGHGRPSRQPAVPREGAPSSYAATRDTAVALSLALLERQPSVVGAERPVMSLDRVAGTYRCWSLPVQFNA